MITFGEFAPDIAPYETDVMMVADNCVPRPLGYGPIPAGEIRNAAYDCGNTNFGCVGFTVIDPDAVPGIGDYVFILATYDNTLGELELHVNGTDRAQSGLTISGSVLQRSIVFVEWDTDLLVFGTVQTPQKIALDDLGSGSTSDIGGSPPQARTAARVGQHLVLGYISVTGGKNLVRWSAFDDYEGWTNGTDLAGQEFLDVALGWINQVVGGAEYGLVFMRKGIVRMDYTGDPGTVWDFSPIDGAPGSIAPECAVRVGPDVYYLSQAGFCVLRNGVQVEPLGENRVDRWWMNNAGINYDSAFNARAALTWISASYVATAHQIWWTFAGPGETRLDTPRQNNRVIIYDIKTNRFSTMTADIQRMAPMPPTLTDDSGDRHFEEFGVAWVSNDGSEDVVYLPTGDAMAATLETSHLYSPKKKMSLGDVRPVIEGTATVSALTKEDLPNDTESEVGPLSVDASGKADFHIEGRYHRLKFITSGDFENAVGYVANATETGEQ